MLTERRGRAAAAQRRRHAGRLVAGGRAAGHGLTARARRHGCACPTPRRRPREMCSVWNVFTIRAAATGAAAVALGHTRGRTVLPLPPAEALARGGGADAVRLLEAYAEAWARQVKPLLKAGAGDVRPASQPPPSRPGAAGRSGLCRPRGRRPARPRARWRSWTSGPSARRTWAASRRSSARARRTAWRPRWRPGAPRTRPRWRGARPGRPSSLACGRSGARQPDAARPQAGARGGRRARGGGRQRALPAPAAAYFGAAGHGRRLRRAGGPGAPAAAHAAAGLGAQRALQQRRPPGAAAARGAARCGRADAALCARCAPRRAAARLRAPPSRNALRVDTLARARPLRAGPELAAGEAADTADKLRQALHVAGAFRAAYAAARARSARLAPANPWRFAAGAVLGDFDAFLARLRELQAVAQTALLFQRLERVEVGGSRVRGPLTCVWLGVTRD